MYEFIDSNFFQTLVTFLVGLFAYIIYKVQKNDKKTDAARSIILEIQNAERSIGKVRDAIKQDNLDVDVSVLQSESWSTSKILFVRDFDSDEWDVLSDFFNRAKLIDDAISNNKIAFANDLEQIRTNRQAALARYAIELLDEIDNSNGKSYSEDDFEHLTNMYDLISKAFDMLYKGKQNEYAFNSSKAVQDIKMYLEGLSNLSTTTIGVKLKKIARI